MITTPFELCLVWCAIGFAIGVCLATFCMALASIRDIHRLEQKIDKERKILRERELKVIQESEKIIAHIEEKYGKI